ncbi:MAG: hypothetical protein KAJ19_16670 [Gammaproteobacteria bacterium]|nr:hypothetical protein [Gammaproteobacteria bacterium]
MTQTQSTDDRRDDSRARADSAEAHDRAAKAHDRAAEAHDGADAIGRSGEADAYAAPLAADGGLVATLAAEDASHEAYEATRVAAAGLPQQGDEPGHLWARSADRAAEDASRRRRGEHACVRAISHADEEATEHRERAERATGHDHQQRDLAAAELARLASMGHDAEGRSHASRACIAHHDAARHHQHAAAEHRAAAEHARA